MFKALHSCKYFRCTHQSCYRIPSHLYLDCNVVLKVYIKQRQKQNVETAARKNRVKGVFVTTDKMSMAKLRSKPKSIRYSDILPRVPLSCTHIHTYLMRTHTIYYRYVLYKEYQHFMLFTWVVYVHVPLVNRAEQIWTVLQTHQSIC